MSIIEKTGIKELDDSIEKLNKAHEECVVAENELKQTVETANRNAEKDCNKCVNIHTEDCTTCWYAGYRVCYDEGKTGEV